MDDQHEVRLSATVSGEVQGVGFRAWVRRRAQSAGLVGSAVNRPDGCVEVIAQGSRPECEKLLAELRSGAAPGSVAGVATAWGSADDNLDDFLLG